MSESSIENKSVYQLSAYGRAVDYETWKTLGGCGLPNNNQVFPALPPMIHWKERRVTLGQIEDACAYTGRAFARFAVERLKLDCMVVPYQHN